MISKKLGIILMMLSFTVIAPAAVYASNTVDVTDISDAIYAEIDAINTKYGMPIQPDLTEAQWQSYDTEVKPLIEKQDNLYKEINKIYVKMDSTSEKINIIDQKYGLAVKYPEHDNTTWDKYNKEIESAYIKLDAHYQQHSSQVEPEVNETFMEYGLVPPHMIEGATDEFVAEVDGILYDKYAHAMLSFGDYTIPAPDKQWMYQIISEQVIPDMQQVYKKYGHDAPSSLNMTQVEQLEQKLSTIYKSLE